MRIKAPALVTLLAGSFFAGTLVSAAQTQSETALVFLVDYMKVEPEKQEEYVRMEREMWKPIHQERIRRGQLRSWALDTVQYPYGAGHEYNFVTVNAFNSLADAERGDLGEIIAAVHPGTPLDEILRQAFDARRLVRGEVWRRLDRVE